VAATSRSWHRLLAGAVLLSILAGCGASGDFGRVRPSPLREKIEALVGEGAAPRPSNSSRPFPFTNEERRLRDLAHPLIDPTYDRDRWNSLLAQPDLRGRPGSYPDRAAYATQLFRTAYRSQTARYNRLIEDIRNDVTRVEPFLSVVNHVIDMDRKREKALAYLSSLTPEQRTKTRQRIEENRAIVQWVHTSLQERAVSYRIALERLVVEAPSPVAVEAERALTLLQQRIAVYGA
jgi:hypothetical protein